jgi:hypothetical protein
VEGSCEHDNEPSGSIKRWEFLEWLSDGRLLKKGSAPWNQLTDRLNLKDMRLKRSIGKGCENRKFI